MAVLVLATRSVMPPGVLRATSASPRHAGRNDADQDYGCKGEWTYGHGADGSLVEGLDAVAARRKTGARGVCKLNNHEYQVADALIVLILRDARRVIHNLHEFCVLL